MEVLLIDDDKNVQTIISSFLNRFARKHSEIINDTAMANPVMGLLEMTNNGHLYDLILLDIKLPKLSGDEIYHNIQKTRPGLVDKIVFVTGFRNELDERFPDHNFNVLDKPFRYEQLEEKVTAILN
jgi:CheY-like chemotaxis protein